MDFPIRKWCSIQPLMFRTWPYFWVINSMKVMVDLAFSVLRLIKHAWISYENGTCLAGRIAKFSATFPLPSSRTTTMYITAIYGDREAKMHLLMKAGAM